MVQNTNNYSNSKKAYAFPTLLCLVLSILLGMMYIFVLVPLDNIKGDIDFGSLVVNTDKVMMLKPAKEFYQRKELLNIYDSSKSNFLQSIQLANSDLEDIKKNTDSDELIICKLDDLNLWYNEIAISPENKDENYDSCLPTFSDVDEQFVDYYKEELEKYINVNGDVDISVAKFEDKDSNKFKVSLDNSLILRSDYSNLKNNFIVEDDLAISSYTDMLQIIETIIPKLSDEFKKEVPKCLLEDDTSELSCMQDVFKNLIKSRNPNVLSDYDFILKDISEVSEKKKGKYMGLEISVLNLDTKNVDISFGIILKDKIPHSSVKFQVENSKDYNSFIDVLVDRPSFINKVNGYYVLYSYENFLSNSNFNSQIIREKLVAENSIGEMFFDTQLQDHNSNKYFYSRDYGLTGVLSSFTDNAKKDQISKEAKFKIPIYQIFNENTNKFEIINKPIYVYVFALDENFNIYLDEKEDGTKMIVPTSIFGPLPPRIEQVTVKGDIFTYENTVSTVITNYNEESFDHFDVYVLDKSKNKDVKITDKCTDSGDGCYFFDGKGVLVKDKFIAGENDNSNLFNFLITSMDNVDFSNVISSKQFAPSFELENGKKYDVYIIPNDKNNLGNLGVFTRKRWDIKDEGLDFKALDSSNVQQYDILYFKDVLIQDKKGPKVEDLKVSGFVLQNNALYLKWDSTNHDINKLILTGTIKDNQGKELPPKDYNIGLDGKILGWSESYNRIKFEGLTIFDVNGNSFTDIKYSLVYPEEVVGDDFRGR